MMGGRADVVMSDMAPNTTGHRKTDQLRIVGLIETAAAFATDVLNPGGTFLAKAFQSGADAELVAQLKRDFASVRHVKPASSRQDSSERYVLAMGFRGQPQSGLKRNLCGATSDSLFKISCGLSGCQVAQIPERILLELSPDMAYFWLSGAVCLSACSSDATGNSAASRASVWEGVFP